MYSQRYSHEHVLWALDNFAVNFEEVGSFKGLKAKEVKIKVPCEVNCLVKLLIVVEDNFVDLLVEEWSLPITFVLAMVEQISNILDGIIGLLSEIVDCDPGSQNAIMGMDNILNKGRSTI